MKQSQLFSVKPLPENVKDVENLISLWRAVLDQAAQDFAYKGKSEDGLRNKEDVERWLKDKKEEFELVCSLAEVDPERAQKEFIRYREGEYDRNKKNLRLSKRRNDIS
jgi:arylsulfatase A-like enzyme